MWAGPFGVLSPNIEQHLPPFVAINEALDQGLSFLEDLDTAGRPKIEAAVAKRTAASAISRYPTVIRLHSVGDFVQSKIVYLFNRT